MDTNAIRKLISEMTLEEKAGLCSGANWFETKAVERLDIPSVQMYDGPAGLRKTSEAMEDDNGGHYVAVNATCFPTGSAMAASWDTELLYEAGQIMGKECQAEHVPLLLGPSMNMKRSPLCGRNFEYMSEDPFLCGKLAAGFVRGVQSQGVGACLKHFAANNQEDRRFSVNEIIDEQALREIYLTAFEIAVKEADPWTIMCAYNMINGKHCCENGLILNGILRDEWGYKGIVMSDWSAVNDRVASLAAGLELEMPYSGPENDNKIVEAVRNGNLDEAILNRAVERMLVLIYKAYEQKKEGVVYDDNVHHAFARRVAADCMVLLKNQGNILPIKPNERVCVIGEMAAHTRYQGGGSSKVTTRHVENILDEIRRKTSNYIYAKGYMLSEDKIIPELIQEAAHAAGQCDIAIVCAGLPDEYESEGYDRTTMKIPESHTALIEAVARANPNTVVVLMNGSPVDMEWDGSATAILEAYLSGQAAAGAVCDILYGDVNPSGKLAETFPIKLEDNPSFLNYAMDTYEVTYHEDVYIGYRYYDKKKMPVRYPFGHGLSYTTFSYGDMQIDREKINEDDTVTVSVKVRNTGSVKGKETIQAYAGPELAKRGPVKTLCAFKKVELGPGEETTVSFTLGKRAFARYDTYLSDWYVDSGTYIIYIGASIADIRLSETIEIVSTAPLDIHANTTVGDLLSDERTSETTLEMLNRYVPDVVAKHCDTSDYTMKQYFKNMPLRQAHLLSKGGLSEGVLNQYIEKLKCKVHG